MKRKHQHMQEMQNDQMKLNSIISISIFSRTPIPLLQTTNYY